MSNRYVALLRGVNIGRNNLLAMSDFKAVLDGLGYDEVKTYLRSGQAVFTADAPTGATGAAASNRIADAIDQAIAAEIGMDVRVVVRTRAELAAVLKANPFTKQESDPTKLFCVFLSDKVTAKDLAEIDPETYEPERFAVARGGRHLYLWLPKGMGVSALGVVKWERVTGKRSLVSTARNWRTTTKLLELLDG